MNIIYKSIFLLFLICSVSAARIAYYNDPSTIKINLLSNPDLDSKQYIARQPVYLVSYADGKEVYFQNQNMLEFSSLNRGVDFSLKYKKSLISEEFYSKHKEIFNPKNRASFWLWKPWVIKDAMSKAPEGSIIIYSDSGFAFKDSVLGLIEELRAKDVLLVTHDPEAHQYPIEFTKRDIFSHFNCDDKKCHYGKTIWAGFMVLRNSPESRGFIDKWLSSCEIHGLIDNSDGKLKNYPEFKFHHHDQAILTAFANSQTIFDVNYIKEVDLYNFVKWHHRGENKKYKSVLYSGSHFKNTKTESYFFSNFPIVKLIREFKNK
jgi:hypothetical protein